MPKKAFEYVLIYEVYYRIEKKASVKKVIRRTR
jgi:hypothetical protein